MMTIQDIVYLPRADRIISRWRFHEEMRAIAEALKLEIMREATHYPAFREMIDTIRWEEM